MYTISRRDLYDARFQVIVNDKEHGPAEEDPTSKELEFLEAPSDLVSGVYEGGLKTWECSLDLAAHAHELFVQPGAKHKSSRILEVWSP